MNVEANKKNEINSNVLEDNSVIMYPKDFGDENIFHYTSVYGLNGILENKKLRFTNIKYMNDKDEFKAGIESLFEEGSLSKSERDKCILQIDKIINKIFICCFSLDRDSLPLWNYYTKDSSSQGYNIEFDKKLIIQSILKNFKNNKALSGCEMTVGNVEYINNNDYNDIKMMAMNASKMAINEGKMDFKGTFLSKILPCISIFSPPAYLGIFSIIILYNLLHKKNIKEMTNITNSCDLKIYTHNSNNDKFEKSITVKYLQFIKRFCFEQEHEYRMVIYVPDECLSALKNEGIYKFRISNGIMIPYLELNFDLDAVKSITISPTIQIDIVEDSLKDYLKFCGIKCDDYSKIIKRSKIPVRF